MIIDPTNWSIETVQMNFLSDDPRWDLFFQDAYINNLKSQCSVLCFVLKRKKSNVVYGKCFFTINEDNVYKSPGRGSFGGFQTLNEVSSEVHLNFIKQVEFLLVTKFKASKILITLPPVVYYSDSKFYKNYFDAGFTIDRAEQNYSISITSQSYNEIIHHSTRKRIKKCRREGFFVKKSQPNELEEAYNIISINRTAKGFPITMSFKDLDNTSKSLNPKISSYLVMNNKNESLAASIVYEVNKDINYVFYWGELPQYLPFSPVVLLAEHLYQVAQKNNKKILDLGTSSVNGTPNQGLVTFKERLGAEESKKYYLIKEY